MGLADVIQSDIVKRPIRDSIGRAGRSLAFTSVCRVDRRTRRILVHDIAEEDNKDLLAAIPVSL